MERNQLLLVALTTGPERSSYTPFPGYSPNLISIPKKGLPQNYTSQISLGDAMTVIGP